MSTRPIAFRWERHFKDGNKESVGDVQSVGTSTAIKDDNVREGLRNRSDDHQSYSF